MTFRNYFFSGYLLHMITLASFSLSLYIGNILFTGADSYYHPGVFVEALLFMWMTSVTILSQLDALSRYQNYKLLRDLIHRHGLKYKFIRAMRHSRCQRDAALVAADTLGYASKIKNYYARAGYRWYHLLPDFLFTNPVYLISWHFWKTTFFARYYCSKYYNY